MSPEVIDDLKQFIETTVWQATAHLATKDELSYGLDSLESRLNKRMDVMQQAIADTITANNDAYDERFGNHDRRLRRLEGRGV